MSDPATSSSPSSPSADALWASMQAALHDVNSTSFFGPSHARALDELREAQLSLAQVPQPAVSSARDDDVRKRREGNDAHFAAVVGGLKEVERRLEEVAGAMRKVEGEAGGVWEERAGGGKR